MKKFERAESLTGLRDLLDQQEIRTLIEGIALGHDIGHAPFGHDGSDFWRISTISGNHRSYFANF